MTLKILIVAGSPACKEAATILDEARLILVSTRNDTFWAYDLKFGIPIPNKLFTCVIENR